MRPLPAAAHVSGGSDPPGWSPRASARRAVYKTVKELMAAAVEEKGFRPGMVSVVRTFGERAKFHRHVHALVYRGG